MKKQIGMDLSAEAGYRGSVKGYAVIKSPIKLLRHYGYVLLPTVYVTERHSYELDVLLLNILHYFIL